MLYVCHLFDFSKGMKYMLNYYLVKMHMIYVEVQK